MHGEDTLGEHMPTSTKHLFALLFGYGIHNQRRRVACLLVATALACLDIFLYGVVGYLEVGWSKTGLWVIRNVLIILEWLVNMEFGCRLCRNGTLHTYIRESVECQGSVATQRQLGQFSKYVFLYAAAWCSSMVIDLILMNANRRYIHETRAEMADWRKNNTALCHKHGQLIDGCKGNVLSIWSQVLE